MTTSCATRTPCKEVIKVQISKTKWHFINVNQIAAETASSRVDSVLQRTSSYRYARWRSRSNRFVKDLCTDSILVMSATVNGDHNVVAYFNSGLT